MDSSNKQNPPRPVLNDDDSAILSGNSSGFPYNYDSETGRQLYVVNLTPAERISDYEALNTINNFSDDFFDDDSDTESNISDLFIDEEWIDDGFGDFVDDQSPSRLHMNTPSFVEITNPLFLADYFRDNIDISNIIVFIDSQTVDVDASIANFDYLFYDHHFHVRSHDNQGSPCLVYRLRPREKFVNFYHEDLLFGSRISPVIDLMFFSNEDLFDIYVDILKCFIPYSVNFDSLVFISYDMDISSAPNDLSAGNMQSYLEDDWLDLEPQGDLDPTTSSEAGPAQETEPTVGVDLIENRGKNIASPSNTLPLDLRVIGNQFEPHIYESLTSRWNNIGTLSWSTGQAAGTIIDTLDLPSGVYNSLLTNPAYLPLNQYLYFRPNITLKYQLNATAFHSGLLVIGVQYYTKIDATDEGLRTPNDQSQVWQLDCATTFAANSNTIEVEVPFQSPLDMIPIRNGVIGSQAYYATVFVAVVSPLAIGDGGSTSVTLTRQVKFECQSEPTIFFCQQPSLAPLKLSAQGFSDFLGNVTKSVSDITSSLSFLPGVSDVNGVANAASGLIDTVVRPIEGLFGGLGQTFKASDMDKPLVPLDAVNFVRYPVALLSSGNGPFIGKSLRLDPSTTSPHHPAQLPTNGTILDNHSIADKWGFVSRNTISVTQPLNSIVVSVPVSPIQYASHPLGLLPTPVTGVAMQYSYWSGSLIFKFKLVKAGPHSVRLRITTNPSAPPNQRNCIDYFSTIQDFEEITEIDYVVPFMGPTPELPVYYNGKPTNCGFVTVTLESFLITMPSIATSVDLITLVRAGPDLNFSVPRSILNYPAVSNENYPEYTWQNNSSQVLQVYRASPITVSPNSSFGQTLVETFTTIPPNSHLTLPIVINNIQYSYYISTSNLKGAVVKLSNPKTIGLDISYVYESTSISEENHRELGGTVTGSITLTKGASVSTYSAVAYMKPTNNKTKYIFRVVDKLPTRLEPQGDVSDEREDISNPQGPTVTPTGAQQLVHGESFNLRTCLRRFELYQIMNLTSATQTGYHAFAIPLQYGAPGERFAGYRPDNLTFCHDAFRFGKGSLRYNLIVNHSNYPNAKIMVYHVPGGTMSYTDTNLAWLPVDLNTVSRIRFFGHEVVADATTSVPFEVPYYNYVKSLVNGADPTLDTYSANAMYSFGMLVFLVYVPSTDMDLRIHLERALGDDADLYVFQGWPVLERTSEMLSYVNFNAESQLTTSNLTQPILLEPQGEVEEPEDTPPDFRLRPQRILGL